MGLLSSSKSTTTNLTENNAFDNRIGVDGGEGGAQLVQIEGGTYAPVTNTTTITEQVDAGVLETAGIIARGAVDLGQEALARNAEAQRIAAQVSEQATKRAIESAQQATAALASGLTSGYREALEGVQKTAATSLDFGRRLTETSIEALSGSYDKGLNYATDLAGRTIDAVLQNTKEQTRASSDLVTGFARDLFQANQTESERNFDRISSLATVAVVVIVVGFVLTRGK
jgi:hypothetical protein